MTLEIPSFNVSSFGELLTSEPNESGLQKFLRTESYLSQSMQQVSLSPPSSPSSPPSNLSSPHKLPKKSPKSSQSQVEYKRLLYECTRAGVDVNERRYDHQVIVQRFHDELEQLEAAWRRAIKSDREALEYESFKSDMLKWAYLESCWYRGWLLRQSIFEQVNRDNKMGLRFVKVDYLKVKTVLFYYFISFFMF